MPRSRITTTFEAEDRGASAVIQRVSGGMRDFAGLAFGPVGVIAGATAIAAGVTRLTGQYTAAATEVNRMTRSTGANAESVSRLLYAWRSLGLEGDDLDSVLVELNIKMQDAVDGNADIARAFDQTGISVERLKNLNADDALFAIVDGLQAVNSQSERVNIVDRIFGGDDGRRILPLLEQGSDGIRALGDEAERLGLVLDSESAAGAEAFQRNIQTIERAAQGVGQRAAAAIVNAIGPVVQSVGQSLGVLPDASAAAGHGAEAALLNRLVDAQNAGAKFGDAITAPIIAALQEVQREVGRTAQHAVDIQDRVDALARYRALIADDQQARQFGRGIDESYTSFLTRTGREPYAAEGLAYTPVPDWTYERFRGVIQPPPGESAPRGPAIDAADVVAGIQTGAFDARIANHFEQVIAGVGSENPFVQLDFIQRNSAALNRIADGILVGIAGTIQHRFFEQTFGPAIALRTQIGGEEEGERLRRHALENFAQVSTRPQELERLLSDIHQSTLALAYAVGALGTGVPGAQTQFLEGNTGPYDLNPYEAALQRANVLHAAGAFSDSPRDDFGFYDTINQRQARILESLGFRPSDGEPVRVDLPDSFKGAGGGMRIDGASLAESLITASHASPISVRIAGYTDVGRSQSADFSFDASGALRNQRIENLIDELGILGLTR